MLSGAAALHPREPRMGGGCLILSVRVTIAPRHPESKRGVDREQQMFRIAGGSTTCMLLLCAIAV